MNLPCYYVDAFTRRIFHGNPAAVCPLDAWLPDALLQAIANENNLSETAFFVSRSDGDYDLRWFTPTMEVDLCGHATLAAAFVLLEVLAAAKHDVKFHTRSGPLTVIRTSEGFVLNLPSWPPVPTTSSRLAEALGAAPQEVLQATYLLAVFASASEVLALAPVLPLVASLETSAVIVTAPGTGDHHDVDFVSRFFAPAKGIAEDPVTGSAHCTLTPYWAQRLGKNRLRARQLSRRQGELVCTWKGDRTELAGLAVLVKTATLHLPDGTVTVCN